MNINRRDFIIEAISKVGLSLTGLSLPWSCQKSSHAAKGVYLVTGLSYIKKSSADVYGVSFFNLETKDSFFHATDQIGHEIIQHPFRNNEFISIAQRPGRISSILKLEGEAKVRHFKSNVNSHFYGHGVFNKKGDKFLCVENDYNSGKGMIYIRSYPDMKIVERFESFGLGPHEMLWANDYKTLVIANGGQKTHPMYKSGKETMNSHSLMSNVAFIDFEKKKLIKKVEFENKFLSFKHMQIASNGTIGVAIQAHGVDPLNMIIGFLVAPDGKILHLKLSQEEMRLSKYHSLSICFSDDSKWVSFSCPRGDSIYIWSTDSGDLVKTHRCSGPSGVAFHGDSFWITKQDGSYVDSISTVNWKAVSYSLTTKVNNANSRGQLGSHAKIVHL